MPHRWENRKQQWTIDPNLFSPLASTDFLIYRNSDLQLTQSAAPIGKRMDEARQKTWLLIGQV
ncbi:MAG: hypothetical protein EOS26_00430 [Mesorhizobium sp.]|uniref:hypothetical protein n=1 Tax=Mesorhizobium sp. TaxID=1871066 RepID=UPI000FE4EA70|nr:hypothetical protein [Mesorhizobium sp.]RWF79856.1 MAG: hypothetical protein EOS26_00430 [Mesorhizobium sp.]